MENLIEFMNNIKILNKDIAEYFDEKKGIKYILPTSYIFARCDYLELTNDELKKEKFNQTIDKDVEFNYIDTTRPMSKYEKTKNEADRFTIIDGKVKVNQIWNVSNGLKVHKTFNNKEDALKLVNEINDKVKEYIK